MPLFAFSPEEREAAVVRVRPMLDWVHSAPVAELAVELAAAFGPNGPGRDGQAISQTALFRWLFRGHINFADNTIKNIAFQNDVEKQVGSMLREAMQLLEHAELARVAWWGEAAAHAEWNATRFGLATLSSGKSAVRQRIKDRTGL